MDTNVNTIRSLKFFLEKHHDNISPLLLALSGGSDSMALFHSLLDLKKDFLHVAHIDHGWREESSKEARALEEMAVKNGLPFHLICLDQMPDTNREDYFRQKRLEFYQSLCKKYSFQAVLLAHHQDDLLETVLKRIFEGASLQKLYGMEKVSKYKEIFLWRPFLDIPKKELVIYLEENNLDWFEDYTNQDVAYLRARMRGEMIPFLQKSFGKDFAKNLLYLSQRSKDLKKSLDNKLTDLLHKKEEGPLGSYFDLGLLEDFSLFDKEHFFTLLLESEGLEPRRKMIRTICSWSEEKQRMRSMQIQKASIIIDRQKIFFLKQFQVTFPNTLELPPRESGKYTLCIKEGKVEHSSGSWKDLWRGSYTTFFPKQEALESTYELSLVKEGEDKALKKWWSMKKVPIFLRRTIPVIKRDGKVVADFLSGYRSSELGNKNGLYHIKVEIQKQAEYNKLGGEFAKVN